MLKTVLACVRSRFYLRAITLVIATISTLSPPIPAIPILGSAKPAHADAVFGDGLTHQITGGTLATAQVFNHSTLNILPGGIVVGDSAASGTASPGIVVSTGHVNFLGNPNSPDGPAASTGGTGPAGGPALSIIGQGNASIASGSILTGGNFTSAVIPPTFNDAIFFRSNGLLAITGGTFGPGAVPAGSPAGSSASLLFEPTFGGKATIAGGNFLAPIVFDGSQDTELLFVGSNFSFNPSTNIVTGTFADGTAARIPMIDGIGLGLNGFQETDGSGFRIISGPLPEPPSGVLAGLAAVIGLALHWAARRVRGLRRQPMG